MSDAKPLTVEELETLRLVMQKATFDSSQATMVGVIRSLLATVDADRARRFKRPEEVSEERWSKILAHAKRHEDEGLVDNDVSLLLGCLSRQAEALVDVAHLRDVVAALDHDQPWSVLAVLAKFVETATILLNEKDYDGHGWETIDHARAAARIIGENLSAALVALHGKRRG